MTQLEGIQSESWMSASVDERLHVLPCRAGVPLGLLQGNSGTPALKKPNLDPSVLSNYHPILNRPFIVKLLESTVASQLQTFLGENNLFGPFQSGVHSLQSTETAVVKVVNDLLLSGDSGSLSILLLLDLSSAFDIVCHDLLISRLSDVVISGAAYL